MNFGRGSVLEENRLIERLKEKQMTGTVIDVTLDEPLPKHHPLCTCPNTIITQHTADGTVSEIPKKIEWFLIYSCSLKYPKEYDKN